MVSREDTFFPTHNGTFNEMTEGMKPLERHKQNITMFKNLTNHGNTNPHYGSTSLLTGANVHGTAAKAFITLFPVMSSQVSTLAKICATPCYL